MYIQYNGVTFVYSRNQHIANQLHINKINSRCSLNYSDKRQIVVARGWCQKWEGLLRVIRKLLGVMENILLLLVMVSPAHINTDQAVRFKYIQCEYIQMIRLNTSDLTLPHQIGILLRSNKINILRCCEVRVQFPDSNPYLEYGQHC